MYHTRPKVRGYKHDRGQLIFQKAKAPIPNSSGLVSIGVRSDSGSSKNIMIWIDSWAQEG